MHVLKRPKTLLLNVLFGKITGSRAYAREPVYNELDRKRTTPYFWLTGLSESMIGDFDMKKLLAVTGVGVFLLSGYGASTFVKIQAASENQFIARHGTGWFKQAGEQAASNCSKYNKKAIMANTDCNLINPIYGAKECMTIWNCQ